MNIRRYLYWPADELDRRLDQISMYRLVLYCLYAYVGAGVFFSLFGQIAFKPYYILASVIWLVAVCWAANWLLAKAYKVPSNHESSLITGLIMALILSPASSLHGYWVLALCAGLAMLSKYLLTINKRHLLNPAAVGAVMSIVLFQNYASWWIGARATAPLLIIGGILILRKINRFLMVGFFLALYLVIFWLTAGHITGRLLWETIAATPLIFFATVMLTEPLTSPTSLDKSLFYAGITGLFYSISRLHVAPEEALLIGNLVAFALTPDSSRQLIFKNTKLEADSIVSYIFQAPKRVKFRAGQYFRWTLPDFADDNRGNRRYFTISSAPTEKDLMFTIKQPKAQPSGFKRRLEELKPGDTILATQLAGDFILPGLRVKKLAFLAGGVGITPFRSMVKEMADKGRGRDIVLFYAVNSKDEIAFEPLFKKAEGLGLKTFYPLAAAAQDHDNYLAGRLDGGMIAARLPDYKERLFLISGPQAFVAAMRNDLLDLGVPRRNIRTDFFPGYN
jgi:glycine betaine catabolism B